MIVSFINGRVRIRDQRLKNGSFGERLQEVAAGIPGILSLEINPLVGSALIYYDPQQITTEDLLAANEHLFGSNLPAIKPADNSKASFSLAKCIRQRAVAKAVNKGLTLTLAATVATVAFGWRWQHAYWGLAFLGLTGIHLISKSVFTRTGY